MQYIYESRLADENKQIVFLSIVTNFRPDRVLNSNNSSKLATVDLMTVISQKGIRNEQNIDLHKSNNMTTRPFINYSKSQ